MPHYRASIVHRASKAPWIAEVQVTGLETGMARKRADDSVRLTLAGLGLLAPPELCAHLHLLKEWGRPRRSDWIKQTAKRDIVTGTQSNVPQIGGRPKWTQKLLTEEASYLKWLGKAIESVMLDEDPKEWIELRRFWLNALHWYYIGCSEPSDARAAICFSSALESLSNGDGADVIVEMCESVLGMKQDDIIIESRALTLRDAVNEVYRSARSEIVHGGRFVLLQEVAQQRSLGVQIAQVAIAAYRELLEKYEVAKTYSKALDRRDIFLRWAEAYTASATPATL